MTPLLAYNRDNSTFYRVVKRKLVTSGDTPVRPSRGSGNQGWTMLFFSPGSGRFLDAAGENFRRSGKWVLLSQIGFTSVQRVLRLFTE